ncbi:MAG: DUF2950 family protein [Planctomycetota bacterium]|nr:DUF2950 family protein [Planctomycetota bacterium]
MPIVFYCRKCGQKITAPDQAAGGVDKCPNCGGTVQVPTADWTGPVLTAAAPQAAKKSFPTALVVLLVVGVIFVLFFVMMPIIAAIAIPSLLRSRVAANETAACASCKAYAEAQEIYRRTDYDGDGVLAYAQSLRGDHSLLEQRAGAGDLCLIDRSFAFAEGPPSASPMPKAGYCFKVLKAQGPHAPGGARNYVVNGNMTGGYALVAYPSQYDGTGRDTFIISDAGMIYQADLGPQTPALVETMTEFDPDPKTWVVSE